MTTYKATGSHEIEGTHMTEKEVIQYACKWAERLNSELEDGENLKVVSDIESAIETLEEANIFVDEDPKEAQS